MSDPSSSGPRDAPPPRDGIAALLTRRDIAEDGDARQTITPSPAVSPPARAQMIDTIVSGPGEPGAGARDPSVGTLGGLVADITLNETLARGGAGVVHLADQPSLDRRVAVKTLRPNRRTRKEIDALFREACISGRLDHPNIVPVHAIGISGAVGPYIVMKRVEGISWAQHLAQQVDRSEPRWLRRELDILMRVCRAVAFAHARGIVHRDIKPDNVMLGSFGEVFLLDWGTAIYYPDDAVALRRELAGTPAYIAPEVVTPDGEATPQTDVYLLGGCLCHVLTGSPPHMIGLGPEPTMTDVLARALSAQPIELGRDVHAALAQVVHRACAENPAERYATVDAFREALEAYLEHQGSLAATDRADAERDGLFALLNEVAGAAPEGGPGMWSAEQLETEARIQRRFSVCRFAYEQALDQWPENVRAVEGHRELLVRMATHALARDNPTAAGALVSELDQPPLEILEQLEASRLRASQRLRAVDAVRAHREDQRFHGLDWARSVAALTSGAIAGLIGWLLGSMTRAGVPLGPEVMAGVFTGGAVLTGLVALAFRGRILDSARYRLFLRAFIAAFAAAALMEVMAWAAGLPLADTWFILSVMGMVAAAVVAVTVEPAMWICAVIAAAVAPVTLRYPDYAADAVGVGFVVNGIYMAWLVRPGQLMAAQDHGPD